MIAWNLATRGGSFLRISNCILLMFSVVKKCQFLETNFLFTIQIQKLLTYCFFAGIRWHPLFFLPLFFFWCLFGLPSVISCRNTYIESGWTQYNDCLKFGNSWGSFLRISNCILLMFSVVKKCQFLETNFLFTIQIQKLLTYCFFAGIRWHPLFFLPLFFFDVYLGCHQLSAAGIHT